MFNAAIYATNANVVRYDQILLSQVTPILKIMIDIWSNMLTKKV